MPRPRRRHPQTNSILNNALAVAQNPNGGPCCNCQLTVKQLPDKSQGSVSFRVIATFEGFDEPENVLLWFPLESIDHMTIRFNETRIPSAVADQLRHSVQPPNSQFLILNLCMYAPGVVIVPKPGIRLTPAETDRPKVAAFASISQATQVHIFVPTTDQTASLEQSLQHFADAVNAGDISSIAIDLNAARGPRGAKVAKSRVFQIAEPPPPYYGNRKGKHTQPGRVSRENSSAPSPKRTHPHRVQVAQSTGVTAQPASNPARGTATPEHHDDDDAPSRPCKKVRFTDTTRSPPVRLSASQFYGGSSSSQGQEGRGREKKKLEKELERFWKWMVDVDQSAQMVMKGELTELKRLAGDGGEKEFLHGCAIIAGFVVYKFGMVEQEGNEGRFVEVRECPSASTPSAPYSMTDTALKLPEPQRTLLRLTMDWFKRAWELNTGAHVALTRPHLLELGHYAREGDVAKFISAWVDCFVNIRATGLSGRRHRNPQPP